MLPFAVIDRWADNHDPTPVTTYFPNDGLSGTAGWTPNDDYKPTASPADVYIPPYNGNTNHTGWKVTSDYGRQLILKDGSVGNYSTGWAQLVCLSDWELRWQRHRRLADYLQSPGGRHCHSEQSVHRR